MWELPADNPVTDMGAAGQDQTLAMETARVLR